MSFRVNDIYYYQKTGFDKVFVVLKIDRRRIGRPDEWVKVTFLVINNLTSEKKIMNLAYSRYELFFYTKALRDGNVL